MLAATDPMLEDAWVAEHEDHLLHLWEYLQDMSSKTGIHVLDMYKISFPRFCELCYRNSTIPEASLYSGGGGGGGGGGGVAEWDE